MENLNFFKIFIKLFYYYQNDSCSLSFVAPSQKLSEGLWMSILLLGMDTSWQFECVVGCMVYIQLGDCPGTWSNHVDLALSTNLKFYIEQFSYKLSNFIVGNRHQLTIWVCCGLYGVHTAGWSGGLQIDSSMLDPESWWCGTSVEKRMGDAGWCQSVHEPACLLGASVPWVAAVLRRLVSSWVQGGRSTVDCTQILLIYPYNDMLQQQFRSKSILWDRILIDVCCLMIVISSLLPLVKASIGDAYIIK